MKKTFYALTLLLLINTLDANSQYLVNATQIATRTSSHVQSKLNFWTWNTSGMTLNDVIIYKVVYNTVDAHGNPTIASGALHVPLIDSCTYFPLVSEQHGTVFDKTNVPSTNYQEEAGLIFSGNGYLVTMPDYLGMGDNPGIHPYHHWESQATASIDLIRASREFLIDSLQIQDNNQLFLTGYSQGGHATMSVHKYIQDNNLGSEFNIVASAPMAGAYSLSGAQYDLMFDADSSYYMTEFIPYLLASYQLVYGNIYNAYDEIYDPPYDSLINQYLNGNYSYTQWNNMMPKNFYDFFQDSVYNNMLADVTRNSHPINKAFRANDLYNWAPQKPLRMLYNGLDSMVSPQSSTLALDSMTALGAPNVDAINIDPNGTHEAGYVPSATYALNWFDSLKVPCQLVSNILDRQVQNDINIYPNPANNTLFIEYKDDLEIYIYTLTGKLLLKSRINQSGQLDVSTLPTGIYILEAVDEKQNKTMRKKFIKKSR
ncbi:MAG: T9SS type A sorting domain-containing protein [Flavobacteriales bacterium]|nr:T9SS type A sorting domain-containing protein [Flavobacteriales bacterium]